MNRSEPQKLVCWQQQIELTAESQKNMFDNISEHYKYDIVFLHLRYNSIKTIPNNPDNNKYDRNIHNDILISPQFSFYLTNQKENVCWIKQKAMVASFENLTEKAFSVGLSEIWPCQSWRRANVMFR